MMYETSVQTNALFVVIIIKGNNSERYKIIHN